MTRAIVGRWGKNLAVRVPLDVERTIGLTDGETVDIEAADGTLVIRRSAVTDERRRAAREAVEAMRRDRPLFPLGDVTIRELIDEGRRG